MVEDLGSVSSLEIEKNTLKMLQSLLRSITVLNIHKRGRKPALDMFQMLM